MEKNYFWYAQEINFLELPEVIDLRRTHMRDYSYIIHLSLFLKMEAMRQINLVGYSGEDQEFKVTLDRIMHVCGGKKKKIIATLPVSNLLVTCRLRIGDLQVTYQLKNSHINKGFFEYLKHTYTYTSKVTDKSISSVSEETENTLNTKNGKENLLDEFNIENLNKTNDSSTGGYNHYNLKVSDLLDRHKNLRIGEDNLFYVLDDDSNGSLFKLVICDLIRMYSDIDKKLLVEDLVNLGKYLKEKSNPKLSIFISLTNILNRSQLRGHKNV